MTCSSCVYKIEQHLLKINGIFEASISLTMSNAEIKYNQSLIGPREIIESIEKLGYNVQVSTGDSKTENLMKMHEKVTRKWKKSFIFSSIFGVLSMVVMFVFMFLLPIVLNMDHEENPHHMHNMTKSRNISQKHGFNHKISRRNLDRQMDHMNILVLMPGLNLETLLLFILCIPVQVIFSLEKKKPKIKIINLKDLWS